MLTVDIQVIPHDQQRRQTAIDWWTDPLPAALHVRVSAMGNEAFEQIAAHRAYTEALLCLKAGIGPAQIDAFDDRFRYYRANAVFPGRDRFGCYDGRDAHPLDADSSDCPSAPHYRQRQTAAGFERIMAGHMGVDWGEYQEALSALARPVLPPGGDPPKR